ncbi:MAG: ABC transporter ATP-binding protein [Acidobacteria bacterium]|nr:ABC transporter ATP-binding protein [Acidobacteriota bacterium]
MDNSQFTIDNSPAALVVRKLTVRYGPCEVLRDVSFELVEGEIVALLGPNGAGKTTLIKALNGSVPRSSGEILLDDRPIAAYSRRDIARRVAVVAQENETKFPVTVRDFVLAGRFANGSSFGWGSQDDIAAANEALDECELVGFENRLMNELSGGERQRVVLARAIATNAKILLLDEPTANLDLAHQASMFRLVREKCRAENYSAVIITHDINLASEFADRLILLHQGRIFAMGEPQEVLREANLNEVFNVNVLLDQNPASGNVRVTTIY